VPSDNPTRKRTRKVHGPLPSGAEYWETLRAIGESHGLDAVGVAPATHMERAFTAIADRIDRNLINEMQFTFRNPRRSTTPEMSVEGAKSIIVGVRSYARDVDLRLDLVDDETHRSDTGDAIPTDKGSVARVARYAWADHNEGLKQSLSAVMRRLRDDGHRAVVFADDNSIVDRETAYLAGIGWYGKNANILLPSAGSFFVIGCVVTTADLPHGTPIDDGCGVCSRCIPACPTDAIVAPGTIDGNRCLSWLLQKPGVFDRRYRAALHDRIYGCDDCQTSCPQTVRRSVPVQLSKAVSRSALPARATIDVEWLLRADDEAVMSVCEHWYTHQRDPRWIRRNALVILGNIGDPARDEVRSIVSTYASHEDPMLRAHAVWTAARLGYTEVVASAHHDSDPMVMEEIAHLPDKRVTA
jgi:epoxyqueuosine reductase